MGDATWLDYLNRFKFGVPTRFGLADEYTGQLPADNIVNIAMSSFGQGISVTQTQMLRAFTAIANDGVMLEPKFISALYDPNDQSVRKSQKEIVGNPVSKAAASSTRGAHGHGRNRSCLRYHVQPQYRKTKCQCSRSECRPKIEDCSDCR